MKHQTNQIYLPDIWSEIKVTYMIYVQINKSYLTPSYVAAHSLFSPRVKRAIPGKLKNTDPLLSFQINMVEKKAGKRKVMKYGMSLHS